ncbi:uncharacterized protein N7479_001385 [Penicillium vulpinum]|uniref:Uncharacterized protein n=1 Tax=Penicillium vulpinum TaxID=29845 RepID=A0A1V6RUJ0_9EURO|nr:uncharacterized protein N7479_001385 [Penicillium vulpinum]KAJ5971467.1 hypothetical protein N7479_001385 [Penicillium vulpinum]OQE05200.1 hypothetical protein PENVUL_c026G08458 [Penicillium vulpinum]
MSSSTGPGLATTGRLDLPDLASHIPTLVRTTNWTRWRIRFEMVLGHATPIHCALFEGTLGRPIPTAGAAAAELTAEESKPNSADEQFGNNLRLWEQKNMSIRNYLHHTLNSEISR